ncbi:hypothetical protein COCOBI_11-5150 [Coccomyxa sp. Obi]|nr:hypothetical protein COCOBI_11-5150 [Coccomyxa sp. Obi]
MRASSTTHHQHWHKQHDPSASRTACFTADNTTGLPFGPAKCPPGSCVSSLQTQTGSYHDPAFDRDALIPIFYSINITCTDVSSGLATSQLVEGYGTNGTGGVFINPGYEVLKAPNGCLTGIGADVAYPSSQTGSAVFFVSTLYLPINTSHFIGYYPGESPFTNYSTSSLGALTWNCPTDLSNSTIYSSFDGTQNVTTYTELVPNLCAILDDAPDYLANQSLTTQYVVPSGMNVTFISVSLDALPGISVEFSATSPTVAEV